MNKKIKHLIAALVMVFVFASCSDKEDEIDNTVIYKARLSSLNAVVLNKSWAEGASVLTFDKAAKTFKIVTTYTGLTPTRANIRKAKNRVQGPVIFEFEGNLSSPITFQSGVLTETQIEALDDGLYYVNLETEMWKMGEIRGQLEK